MPREEFVSEPIIVDSSSVPVAQLAQGAPSCPKQLRAYDSRETYVKSHSFRIRTDTNLEMVLRCDRQVRGNPWRVFTVTQING